MGFFAINETTNNNNERHKSLRADQKAVQAVQSERISPAVSRQIKASMTVEAAFVLPFFIFCMVNILMIFQMVEYRSKILAAVHQAGNEIARSASAREILPDGAEGAGTVLSYAYVPLGVSRNLGDSISDNGCISNGKSAISYIGSSILLDDDIVDIRASYRVKPAFADLGWKGAWMFVRYYGRGWTGYDVTRTHESDTTKEKMVYITATGTVYHMSRGCRSLNPSIRGIKYDDVAGSRNKDGHRYGICPYCGSHSPGGTVYVTDYGTCYHTSPTCNGLKRTIYCVPISEVGGRGACSICGGG